ncbi:MAG: DUF6056 family protein [Bradyrhizobium sp.]
MGLVEDPAQARTLRRRLAVTFGDSWIWILGSLVPITLLVALFALTRYSIPESDDFCVAYLNATGGFAEAVRLWYNTDTGRAVPLVLMQLPSIISSATAVDYFNTYPLTLAGFEICFISAMVLVSFRLWPKTTLLQTAFIGVALAAMILSGIPSLREMLYWLPGVVCYTLPGSIVMFGFAVFVRTAEQQTPITTADTCLLAGGGFVASMCNEFSGAWFFGLVLCSLAFRTAFERNNLQIRQHVIVGGATLIGVAILLAAPANAVRMAQFPLAGNFIGSAIGALRFFIPALLRFISDPRILGWVAVVIVFTATQPPSSVEPPVRRTRVLAKLVLMFSTACCYLACFTAQYATGFNLVARAQNQTTMLGILGLTISATLFTRASGAASALAAITGRLNPMPFAGAAIGVILTLVLYNSKTVQILRVEQSAFHEFWRESMERHEFLKHTAEQDLVVTRLHAYPTALIEGDLGRDPSRLPNDCVARYYDRKTIVIDR